jgi:transketolase N-terminal domain/subunit
MTGAENTDSNNPKWPQRDRFILSKGHGLHRALRAAAREGLLPEEEL